MNCILCKEEMDFVNTGDKIVASKLCNKCHKIWRMIEMNLDLAGEVIKRIERREVVKGITCNHKNGYVDNGFDQYSLCDKNHRECLLDGHCPDIGSDKEDDPYKHIRIGREVEV